MGSEEILAVIANDVRHIKESVTTLNGKVDKINGSVRKSQIDLAKQKTFCDVTTENSEMSIVDINKKIDRIGKRAWCLIGFFITSVIGLFLKFIFKGGL